MVGSKRMDLDLSAEHQLLRTTICDFMENEVGPVVEEHEREHKFPVDVVRRLSGAAESGGDVRRREVVVLEGNALRCAAALGRAAGARGGDRCCNG